MNINSVGSPVGEQVHRHLLLSFPEPELPFDGTAAIDQMVESAVHSVLQEKGTTAITLIADIQRTIQRTAGLQYETAELVSSVERLERKGYLRFTDPKHLSFIFSEDRYYELDRKLSLHRNRDKTFERDGKRTFFNAMNLRADKPNASGKRWSDLLLVR